MHIHIPTKCELNFKNLSKAMHILHKKPEVFTYIDTFVSEIIKMEWKIRVKLKNI